MNLWDAFKVNGKARIKTWPAGDYITNEISNDRIEGFRNSNGGYTYMSLKRVFCDEWEPLEEPCKHDPGFDGDLAVEILCKHCGVNLKATVWEEVK